MYFSFHIKDIFYVRRHPPPLTASPSAFIQLAADLAAKGCQLSVEPAKRQNYLSDLQEFSLEIPSSMQPDKATELLEQVQTEIAKKIYSTTSATNLKLTATQNPNYPTQYGLTVNYFRSQQRH